MKVKKLLFMGIILVLVLLLFRYIKSPLSSPAEGQIFCSDSDGSLNLQSQSKVFGVVSYINSKSNCGYEINKLNESSELCNFLVVFNDYCYNSTNVIEMTCSNNNLNKVLLNCQNKCQDNKCI